MVKIASRAVFFLSEISRIPDARQVGEWYSRYHKSADHRFKAALIRRSAGREAPFAAKRDLPSF